MDTQGLAQAPAGEVGIETLFGDIDISHAHSFGVTPTAHVPQAQCHTAPPMECLWARVSRDLTIETPSGAWLGSTGDGHSSLEQLPRGLGGPGGKAVALFFWLLARPANGIMKASEGELGLK